MAEKFDESIPFLMHCVVARTVELASAEFSELGLNVAEARVLLAALQYPKIRAGQLSDVTCIAQSTLSHILRRLTEQGLILRERVGDDNRSVMIHLTAAGEQSARACQRLNAMQEQALVAGLTAERVTLLRDLLHRLYTNVGPGLARRISLSAEIQPTRRRARRSV